MDLDEIRAYVLNNYTEADKISTYELSNDNVEKKEHDRIEATVKCREQKAGKNPFKKWFYLGFGKDKFDNVKCKKTSFDKKRVKAFYKWRRKTEENGVTIKRDYYSDYDDHTQTFGLHRYYKYTYSKLKYKIADKFEWHPNLSLWGMESDLDSLVIKLTILGVYHGGGFSHILHSKEQMHDIWYARKLLLEAIDAEKIYDEAKEKDFKEKFHVSWDYVEALTIYSKREYIDKGIVSSEDKGYEDRTYMSIDPRKMNEVISSDITSTSTGRNLVMSKIKEMEEYWHGNEKMDDDNFYLSAFMKIKMRKAFEFIERHIYDWGD